MIERATTPSRLRAVTAYLAVSAGLVGFASLEFMLEPIQADFSMSPNQTIVVGQISGAACLFVVFLVGALADRLGDARVLGSASVVAERSRRVSTRCGRSPWDVPDSGRSHDLER